MIVLEPQSPVWANLLLAHGIGEHSGRYQKLTDVLLARGLRVHRYDHYGHGNAAGKRGSLTHATQLRDDLLNHAHTIRSQHSEPLLLLGHSMGGLIVLDAALTASATIAGVIALSPAIQVAVNPLQRLALPILRRIAPHLAMPTLLPVSGISRDPAVVAAYTQDPLTHDKITPRLAQYILDAGARVRASAHGWCVPTLLLYAGADQLVDPAGSAKFAAHAPEQYVCAQCFSEAYHELHHEPDTRAFYAALSEWLEKQHERL